MLLAVPAMYEEGGGLRLKVRSSVVVNGLLSSILFSVQIGQLSSLRYGTVLVLELEI